MRLSETIPTVRDAEALRIAEPITNMATLGLLTGDFAHYRSVFELPIQVETVSGCQVYETEQELRELFMSIRNYLQVINTTDLVRKFVAAEFLDNETLQTVHESYALQGSTRVVDPIPVMSVFRRIDGVWKVKKTSFVIPDIGEFNDAFKAQTSQGDTGFSLEMSSDKAPNMTNV